MTPEEKASEAIFGDAQFYKLVNVEGGHFYCEDRQVTFRELVAEFTPPPAEPPRPRFMTAWMTDSAELFTPTGDAFMTLEAAEEFALDTLHSDGTAGQIAVFEIRSVHLARLTVTKEAA